MAITSNHITTILYHIIYHTIPYNTYTIPYHTIPYHTIPYHTIPYHTPPHPTITYHTTLLKPVYGECKLTKSFIYFQIVAMSSTILQLNSVAVVKFMTRRPTTSAVVTSTTIPELHNVATTTPSNPRKPRALVTKFKF